MKIHKRQNQYAVYWYDIVRERTFEYKCNKYSLKVIIVFGKHIIRRKI